ncbi:MAG: hypothetical protein EBU54_13270 [Mycobacteriaceae bacterium]|nr:hypothetical protein [Mycobacteriaceae bacterium]
MVGVTRVLAVANQKGGVAKTTTVASLGAAFVDEGQRVLLVDLDPQGCLTFSLGTEPDKLPVSVHEVLLGEVEPSAALVDTPEGMTLLPANIDLAGAEAMLLMRAGREYALKRALDKITGDFDVVIIDCPPSLGVLTLNGLTAADQVIVPLQCETLAHRGVGQFLRTIVDVQQITNPALELLGALPTLYDGDFVSTWNTLAEFAADGRARSIGVSNFGIHHLQELARETDTTPAVNQIEVHPYFGNDDVRAYGTEHDIVTESWSPIARGTVLGDPVVIRIAKAAGVHPAQVVLRWHIQRGDVVFPKSVHPQRMRENFEIFDFELSDEEVEALTALDRGEQGRIGPNPDTFAHIPT